MAAPLILKSRLLAERSVPHGFSTRIGGVSEGPFATLNVAVGPGDDPAAVAENLRRFAVALGFDPERLFQTSQVHGAHVRVVSAEDQRLAVVKEEADALVSRDPRLAIGVRVADCVPVLLHEGSENQVAAVHAGWRGVVGGAVQNGVAHLAQRPRSSGKIAAAIGPCIGPCCFEVGEEVADALLGSVPDESIVKRGDLPKPHVDLRLAVRLQLRALGVPDDAIEDVPGCTKCDAERFYSHRRDGARSGRLLAAIAPTS